MTRRLFAPLVKCEGFNLEDCGSFMEPAKGKLCDTCSNRVKQARAGKQEKSYRKQRRRSA